MISLDALQDLIPAVGASDDVEAIVKNEAAHLRPWHEHARVVAPVAGHLIGGEIEDGIDSNSPEADYLKNQVQALQTGRKS